MLLGFWLFITQGFADETADIKVTVKGMVCSFCVQGIEKTFTAEEAVEKVTVNLDESLVSIWLKQDQNIKDGRIDTLVKDSGYNVAEIKRSSPNPPK